MRDEDSNVSSVVPSYATAKSTIATLVADGRVPLLDVDASAAVSIQNTGLKACYVLIQPSSAEVFKKHLDSKKPLLPPHTDLAKMTSNFETVRFSCTRAS